MNKVSDLPLVRVEGLLSEARAAAACRVTAGDLFRFVVVSAYLGLVLVWLVASRQVRPGLSVRRSWQWLVGRLRYRVPLPVVMRDIAPDSGHCYLAPVDHRLASDYNGVSRLRVCEDGVPLPRPHAHHHQIREQGGGAYSHWVGAIYFSSSDNTDPRTNGRTYTYQEGPA